MIKRKENRERAERMLEGRTPEDLSAIAHDGGGLEINGAAYSSEDLVTIANAAAGSSCPLIIIRNSRGKTTAQLRSIAHAGKGKVLFG